MPEHVQVPRLLTLSTTVTSRWLLRVARKWPGVQARKLQRSYISSIVGTTLRQHLVSAALSKHIYDQDLDWQVTFIELLADNTTKVVDVSKSGHHYVDGVFSLYRAITSALAVNLTSLGITCLIKGPIDLKFVIEVNNIFYRTMKQMKCLTNITLKGIGDTEMLSIIGKTCRNLECLDVSQSQKVNDESVASLMFYKPEKLTNIWEGKSDHFMAKRFPCCKKLRFLGITATDVTTQGVCSLLQLMPNLESFGGYLHGASLCSAIALLYGEPLPSYHDSIIKLNVYDVVPKTGLVQVCVGGDSSEEENDNAEEAETEDNDEGSNCEEESSTDSESDRIPIPGHLPLTHLWETLITKKQAEVIPRVCSRVLSVDTSLSSLDALKDFCPLQHLAVDCDYKFYSDKLWCLLESHGKSLESLLVRNPMTDFLPFDYLQEWCPMIESVSAPLCISDHINAAELTPWTSLTHANICMPSRKDFSTFCSVAVNISELYFSFSPEAYTETVENFNDAFMSDVLKQGGLKSIRKLVIGRCCLSGATLDMLVIHCPLLQFVGGVDLWQNLTRHQLEQTRLQIRVNNWDLTLAVALHHSTGRLLYE